MISLKNDMQKILMNQLNGDHLATASIHRYRHILVSLCILASLFSFLPLHCLFVAFLFYLANDFPKSKQINNII